MLWANQGRGSSVVKPFDLVYRTMIYQVTITTGGGFLSAQKH